MDDILFFRQRPGAKTVHILAGREPSEHTEGTDPFLRSLTSKLKARCGVLGDPCEREYTRTFLDEELCDRCCVSIPEDARWQLFHEQNRDDPA